MTNKQKLINLYKKALKIGKLPNKSGLCNELEILNIELNNLELFEPPLKIIRNLLENKQQVIWWGAESSDNPKDVFTPLRQTVLGFLIAMENYDKTKK